MTTPIPAGETPLSIALQTQDSAAVAFALRNGPVVVPLLAIDGPSQVRVFRAPGTETNTLLLFSAAEHYVRMVPKETDHRVVGYDREELTEFLNKHLESIGTVWFDVAGPHPMQADPRVLLTALTL